MLAPKSETLPTGEASEESPKEGASEDSSCTGGGTVNECDCHPN